MALSATVFKFELAISDIDHGYYADHSLTVARHPSENDERMTARLLAFALRAHRQPVADAALVFGPGLSTPDVPDLALTDHSGSIVEWIDVGQPDEKAITKAARRAETAVLYAFSSGAETWWRAVGPRVSAVRNLHVARLPHAAVRQLASHLTRRTVLNVTVLDQMLTVGVGTAGGDVAVEVLPEDLPGFGG